MSWWIRRRACHSDPSLDGPQCKLRCYRIGTQRVRPIGHPGVAIAPACRTYQCHLPSCTSYAASRGGRESGGQAILLIRADSNMAKLLMEKRQQRLEEDLRRREEQLEKREEELRARQQELTKQQDLEREQRARQEAERQLLECKQRYENERALVEQRSIEEHNRALQEQRERAARHNTDPSASRTPTAVRASTAARRAGLARLRPHPVGCR